MQPPFYLNHFWYIVARSHHLGKTPLACHLGTTPIVLFRDDSAKVHALLDRCPHRNVPLSLGRCVQGHLECAYHGWRFAGDGACKSVPGLPVERLAKVGAAEHFATRESAGYVWMYSSPNVEPADEPPSWPYENDKHYSQVAFEFDYDANVFNAAENILDVPHTAFLHRGLFRNAAQRTIDVIVTRGARLVQAQYLGEKRPSGLLGRLLAPAGGEGKAPDVEHYDRFMLPSIAQVDYRLSENAHIVVTNCLTPLSEFKTRLYTRVAFRLPFWLRPVRYLVTPIALHIARQDARVLTAQARSLQQFGGEQFFYTAADVLGPHILRLFRAAERQEIGVDTQPVIERSALVL